jgi:hypothetical protein
MIALQSIEVSFNRLVWPLPDSAYKLINDAFGFELLS